MARAKDRCANCGHAREDHGREQDCDVCPLDRCKAFDDRQRCGCCGGILDELQCRCDIIPRWNPGDPSVGIPGEYGYWCETHKHEADR